MLCSETPLGRWLQQHGGRFHPTLEFRRDAFGTSVYATETFQANASAVTCPFSIAITPTSCRQALLPWISSPSLTDHQATCLYLLAHRLPPSNVPEAVELKHQVYVDTLPTSFETPLWWNDRERQLLRGTNLYGAVNDREQSWKEEHAALLALLPDLKPEIPWQLYLWACTVLSSRAFPSSLITGPETVDPDPSLFPGVDTLNHQYATVVTWSSDVKSPTPGVSIIIEESVPKDQQVFNSYGPKPSEELLLGYGFIPSSNPSDLLILALSKPPSVSPLLQTTLDTLGLSQNWRHQVPRSGILPRDLVEQVRWITAGTWPSTDEGEMRIEEMVEGGRSVFLGYEVEFEAINALASMIANKMGNLVAVAEDETEGIEGVKEERREMVRVYRQGQLEILQVVDAHLDDLMQALEDRAEKDGFDFALLLPEDDAEEEGDEMV